MFESDVLFINPKVMSIELSGLDVLTININDKIVWVVSDQLRESIISECIRVIDTCDAEADPYISAVIETLQFNLTREDLECIECDCQCDCIL